MQLATTAFPKLYPTLMLIYIPTSPKEFPIVAAIVKAGASHVGTGDLGMGWIKILYGVCRSERRPGARPPS